MEYSLGPDWFSGRIEPLTYLMKHYMNTKLPMNILEIGCFEGRSTIWFIDNMLTHEDSHIDVIDTFEGSVENHEIECEYMKDTLNRLYETFLKNISRHIKKVTVMKGYSHNHLIVLNLSKKNSYDFIYIDGDHRGFNVLRDAVLSFSLLKLGGCIAFDDYEWTGKRDIDSPKMAIDTFLSLFKDYLEVLYVGYQLYVRKIKHSE